MIVLIQYLKKIYIIALVINIVLSKFQQIFIIFMNHRIHKTILLKPSPYRIPKPKDEIDRLNVVFLLTLKFKKFE